MLRRKAVQDGKEDTWGYLSKGGISPRKEESKGWRKVRREGKRKALKTAFENNERRLFISMHVWKLIHNKYIKFANERHQAITIFTEDKKNQQRQCNHSMSCFLDLNIYSDYIM